MVETAIVMIIAIGVFLHYAPEWGGLAITVFVCFIGVLDVMFSITSAVLQLFR